MIFYLDNRLDAQFERDPRDVAREFIKAVRDGYDISRCRASAEFAFRWWLSDPKGFQSSWGEEDTDELMEALFSLPEEDRKLVWDKLMEGVR